MDYFGDMVGGAALQAAANDHDQRRQMALYALQQQMALAQQQAQQQGEIAAYGAKSGIDTTANLKLLAAQQLAKEHQALLDQTHGNLLDYFAKMLPHARSVRETVEGFKSSYPTDPYAQALDPTHFDESLLPEYQKGMADIAAGKAKTAQGQQEADYKDPATLLPLEAQFLHQPEIQSREREGALNRGNAREIAGLQSHTSIANTQATVAGANERAAGQQGTQLQIAAGNNATSTANNQRTTGASLQGAQIRAQSAATPHFNASNLTAAMSKPPQTFLGPEDLAEFNRVSAELHYFNAMKDTDTRYRPGQARQDQYILNNLTEKGAAARERYVQGLSSSGGLNLGVPYDTPGGPGGPAHTLPFKPLPHATMNGGLSATVNRTQGRLSPSPYADFGYDENGRLVERSAAPAGYAYDPNGMLIRRHGGATKGKKHKITF